MNLSAFRKLLSIAYDDRISNVTKQAIIDFCSLGFLMSLILLGIKNFGTAITMEYYIGIYLALNLILLFFTAAVLKSIPTLSKFVGSMPIKPTAYFYKVYLVSSLKFFILLEYLIAALILLWNDTSLKTVIIFVILLEAIRFLRLYFEFLFGFLKSLPGLSIWFSMLFFSCSALLYVLNKKQMLSLSIFQYSPSVAAYIIIILTILGLLTGPLLAAQQMNQFSRNAMLYFYFTSKLMKLSTRILYLNKHTKAMLTTHITRLLRNSDYMGRIIRIFTVVTLLSCFNDVVLAPFFNMPKAAFVDIPYMICLVTFLTLQLEYPIFKNSYLDEFPITNRKINLIIDLIDAYILVLFLIFLMLIEFATGNSAIQMTGVIFLSFFSFYFISRSISIPQKKLSNINKLFYYFQFFILSIPLKIVMDNVPASKWHVHLTVFFACLSLYCIRKKIFIRKRN
ncbi:hypothetical protein [Paenibacillus sp. Leaf72]|uniref:hypothetical protein n=1 Tax=Paenibacillus sp. Leaf72 TaxID=1736234 RepID=UPI0006F3F14F|nr:hypothetical protein [Paenibacillus sp. Leaf72]KQO15325.1 hypothetical protein ASF12_27935 [Paenibacillus sp. Leaf72]